MGNITVVDDRLKHIGIIMDGNGRWAKKRFLPREAGHVSGASVMRDIVRNCFEFGIKAVTLYAFSTENWSRPKSEVNAIMTLFENYLKEELRDIDKNNINIHFLGDRSVCNAEMKRMMDEIEEKTAEKKSIVNICFNYGGRDEIVHAANAQLLEGSSAVTADGITENLYTRLSPPLDLIIRTGGEMRLSNFLLWQSAYAELYFTDVLWPDFNKKELGLAIEAFYSRKRRFGGLDAT